MMKIDAVGPDRITWQDHHGPVLASRNGYDVITCAVCGFAHAVPLPTPEELNAEYRERYYSDEKPTYLAHAREDQIWARLSQDDRLDVLERLLPSSRRRLIDIGCGPGFFLQTACARGWQGEGLEPSQQASDHARSLGLCVHQGFFSVERARTLGRFDAVHMNNVLEHVPNPLALLTAAFDLLEPDGVLVVGVPNDFSPLQIAAAAQGLPHWWVAPPHHLNYFDFSSLSSVLEQLGFVLRERQTSFPMEMFLLMGENYTADAALGRDCHTRRKRFDLALAETGLNEVRQHFYRGLADAGLGREAIIFAVRP
jgi:2-polyprenyl-3-methyl-5-hydroxy-6-metoxy-1,4-benzoquinol methylase